MGNLWPRVMRASRTAPAGQALSPPSRVNGVSRPTRPMNMVSMMMTLPITSRDGVMPGTEPCVPSAEVTSGKGDRAGSGWVICRPRAAAAQTSRPAPTTVTARLIVAWGTRRFATITSPRPVMLAQKVRASTAMVVVLTPPAVPPGLPMNIHTCMNKQVGPRTVARSTELKPAVRRVTDWNQALCSRSTSASPASALSHSNTKARAPARSRAALRSPGRGAGRAGWPGRAASPAGAGGWPAPAAEQDQQGDRVQDERVGLERHEVRAVQGETGVAERGNRGEQPLPQGPRQGGAGRQEAASEQHRAGQLNQQGETDDERQRGERILVAGLGEGGEQPLPGAVSSRLPGRAGRPWRWS